VNSDDNGEGFRAKLEAVFGDKMKVVQAAFDELFNHGNDVGLDYDDQVSSALRIGVMAGTAPDIDEFIRRYEAEILN
jgi:hypothetical protein